MNNISIPDFLDLIDKEQKIDRKQAFLDISLIALSLTFRKASTLLPDVERQKVLVLLSDAENLQFRKIYSIFEAEKKLEDLQKIMIKTSKEIQKDYIKTQFASLNDADKARLLDEHPELKQIEE